MSKYDLFRRRIAPVAFVLALGLIAYDTCDKQERTHSTVVLDFGAAEPSIRSVEAEIWMNTERVTHFRRAAVDNGFIGPVRFATSLPDTKGELRVDVDMADGAHKQLVRQLEFREGETLTVRLERDLR